MSSLIPLGFIPSGLPRSERARHPQGLNGDGSSTPGFDHTASYGTQGIRLVPVDTSRLAARSFISTSHPLLSLWGSRLYRTTLAILTPLLLAAAQGQDLDARLDALVFKEPVKIPEIVAGGRPSLLVFTDHHCAACLQMVPVVERLTQKYTGRANVITIDPQDPNLAVRLLSAKYGVWGTPMMVLLDRTAIVRKKLYGPQLERTLAGDLDRLLRTMR